MPEEQMRVTWTKDVSLEDLRKLSTELGSDFEIEIDEMPRSYKSAVPPSWVRCYAENSWWIKGLGAYAAIYVAEIVTEAAKNTWKNPICPQPLYPPVVLGIKS